MGVLVILKLCVVSVEVVFVEYVYFFFFFQAEDGIRDCGRDWSSDVCSSDLAYCLS